MIFVNDKLESILIFFSLSKQQHFAYKYIHTHYICFEFLIHILSFLPLFSVIYRDLKPVSFAVEYNLYCCKPLKVYNGYNFYLNLFLDSMNI